MPTDLSGLPQDLQDDLAAFQAALTAEQVALSNKVQSAAALAAATLADNNCAAAVGTGGTALASAQAQVITTLNALTANPAAATSPPATQTPPAPATQTPPAPAT